VAKSLTRAAADGRISLEELARAVLDAINAAAGLAAGGKSSSGLGDLLSKVLAQSFSGARADGGAVMAGGRINMQKAAEIVLHELRGGGLGRITLETPQDLSRWQPEAAVKEAERAALKAAKSAKPRASRSEA
jgi:ribosome biogenesis GTPase A